MQKVYIYSIIAIIATASFFIGRGQVSLVVKQAKDEQLKADQVSCQSALNDYINYLKTQAGQPQ